MDRTNEGRGALLIAVLLGLITLAALWPALRNGFVGYDDPDYVTSNATVMHGLTWDGVKWAFAGGHAGNWHPLTWLSHMVDCSVYGLKPAGHHLTSLALHVITTMLLFWALLRMTGGLWASALVAGLFGVHPMHVESVAWVAERKDVLSALFFALTLLAWERYAGATHPPAKRKWLWYSAALAFLACGLMSKPMLVTVPFVLLLLDFWPLRRFAFSGAQPQPGAVCHKPSFLLLEKVPFAVLALASSLITFLVQRGAGAVSSLENLPLEFRISNALVSYVRYATKLFWPANLAAFYPPPKEYPFEWIVGAAILLLGITTLVLWLAKRQPHLPVGWFWFLGMLVPVIGIVQVGQQAMADRYSYLPHIGLLIMLAWTRLPPRLSPSDEERAAPGSGLWKIAGTFAGIAVIVGCIILTRQQVAYWASTQTLFQHALDATTHNWVAHNNLGSALVTAGDHVSAEPHFRQAIQIKPGYFEALVNLAVCRDKNGQNQEALELFQHALEAGPNYALAHYNFANALTAAGRLDEAESHYQRAVALKPELAEAWHNFGILKEKKKDKEGAVQCYHRALEIQPGYIDPRLNVAGTLISSGKLDEAINELEQAKQFAPTNADVHFNLANAFLAKTNPTAAITEFSEACRLRPADLEARANLVGLLMNEGKLAEARPHLEQLLEQRPAPQWHYLLALILDAQMQPHDALPHYREAIKLSPKAPAYLNDLAWLLATSTNQEVRNGAEAVKLAEQACALAGGKEPRFWGTLDAAYAEAGRFDEAVKAAQKTHELALTAGQTNIAVAAEQRLTLYRAGKPFRNTPDPQR